MRLGPRRQARRARRRSCGDRLPNQTAPPPPTRALPTEPPRGAGGEYELHPVSARPRCETQGRRSGRPRRAPGQGKSDRGSKEEVKERSLSSNPLPTKPSGSWVHLPFSPKINQAAAAGAGGPPSWAAAARGADSWPPARARPLSAVLTLRSPWRGRFWQSAGLPALLLRETAILWSLPRPEDGQWRRASPVSPPECVGEQKVAQRSRGLWAGCHRRPAPN